MQQLEVMGLALVAVLVLGIATVSVGKPRLTVMPGKFRSEGGKPNPKVARRSAVGAAKAKVPMSPAKDRCESDGQVLPL
jgi:hypothetical protein